MMHHLNTSTLGNFGAYAAGKNIDGYIGPATITPSFAFSQLICNIHKDFLQAITR